MNTTSLPPAGFFRRLGALFYDSLIVIAILMMAGGVVVAIMFACEAAGIMNYGQYLDASDLLSHHPVWSPIYTIYLVFVWLYFFVYFWTRAGQTLGMRAWKIVVRSTDGSRMTITQALIRLATSFLGLGNLTVIVDPKKRSLQDMLAKTEVVVLPKVR